MTEERILEIINIHLPNGVINLKSYSDEKNKIAAAIKQAINESIGNFQLYLNDIIRADEKYITPTDIKDIAEKLKVK